MKQKQKQNYNQDYTVTTDGFLRVDEIGIEGRTATSSDRYQYYKIISIDGSKISLYDDDTSLTQVQNTNTVTQYFFTNQVDAQTYLDSL